VPTDLAVAPIQAFRIRSALPGTQTGREILPFVKKTDGNAAMHITSFAKNLG
jgi:hypothetical protein